MEEVMDHGHFILYEAFDDELEKISDSRAARRILGASAAVGAAGYGAHRAGEGNRSAGAMSGISGAIIGGGVGLEVGSRSARRFLEDSIAKKLSAMEKRKFEGRDVHVKEFGKFIDDIPNTRVGAGVSNRLSFGLGAGLLVGGVGASELYRRYRRNRK